MKHLSTALSATLILLSLHGTAHAGPDACTQTERQVWYCEANGKFYTLCASQDLGPNKGYLQYRAYKGATQEFAYPSAPRHPFGLFKLDLLPRGAALRFKYGAYDYEIHEPLAGSTEILVSKNRKTLARLSCSDYMDSLTLTSTQDFFSRIGIYDK